MPDYERSGLRDVLLAAFYLVVLFPVAPLLVGGLLCQALGLDPGRP